MPKTTSFSLTTKKTKQKKGSPQLGLRLPSLPQLPAAGPKTRFTQTVWTLAPHATTPLGGVEWDFKNSIKLFWG